MKKRLGVLALATAMLLGMTGCGGQKEETAEPATPTGVVEKKVEPVTFESGVELQED